MQHLIFEFATEQEMRETVQKLWDGHNVSGEVSIRPISGGKWRLEVYAETTLRESTLEKFSAYRVEDE